MGLGRRRHRRHLEQPSVEVGGGCEYPYLSCPSSVSATPRIYVAADGAGGVYVADSGNNRVMKLTAGASAPTVLPFTGLSRVAGVAVDTAGGVYVTDGDDHRVVKLAAGASTQTVLPFTGLNHPYGVAVDTAGSVYVTDRNTNRVLKLDLRVKTSPSTTTESVSGNNVSRCTPSCFKRAAFACAFPICLFVSWSRCATDSGRPRRYQSRAPEPFRSV